jgi:hypothetical protein
MDALGCHMRHRVDLAYDLSNSSVARRGRLRLGAPPQMETTVEGIGTWSNFLTAAAGVTSALTGLVFIALSINLTHIMRLQGVSGRAGEAILILTTMLIGLLVALVPNLAPIQLGMTFLALGLATWGVPTALQLRAFVHGHHHRSSFAISLVVCFGLRPR